ncbi:hypothetical protein BD414DRAFT_485540 [Trametes punicea]|nr:hypothetical protein BD414DRAFT_485540 [Trametes punicea]
MRSWRQRFTHSHPRPGEAISRIQFLHNSNAFQLNRHRDNSIVSSPAGQTTTVSVRGHFHNRLYRYTPC